MLIPRRTFYGALALAAVPYMAHAEDRTRSTWGMISDTAQDVPVEQQSLGRMVLSRDGETLLVTVTNGLHVAGPEGVVVERTLTIDGLEVEVVVNNNSARRPDEVFVVAPPGWIVEPQITSIEEDEVFVFVITPMLVG